MASVTPRFPKAKPGAPTVEVRTQAELDAALEAGNVAKIVAGVLSLAIAAADAPTVIVTGDAHLTYSAPVEAWGSSTVVARESSTVEARGSSTVVAWGSSTVVAWGSSRVVAWGSSTVEARGSSTVEARGSSTVVARESSRVVARGSSTVEARGSSTVVARESSTVVAWESSTVEAWGSSTVVAWESSRVVARESSRVEAWESSRVEAWGSSRVVAWGSSRVVAWGLSMLHVRSARCTVQASDRVSVNLWAGAKATGGRQQVVDLSTPADWCDYYGVRVVDGVAVVYKAVGADYISKWGACYAPGTMPEAPDWDGGERECGGGLHFSPTPRATHRFVSKPVHYLECRVRLSDMAVRFDGHYPEKCKARCVAEPLVEVDVDGRPVIAGAAA